jgi:Ca2+-binding EF-hand superfamily protein
MKGFQTMLALSIMVGAGIGLANADEPQSPPATQTEKMDHHQMKADHHSMKMDHEMKPDAEFAKLDKNHDGKISKDEIPADSPMSEHFDMMDTDKDGSLSQEEFVAHHDM